MKKERRDHKTERKSDLKFFHASGKSTRKERGRGYTRGKQREEEKNNADKKILPGPVANEANGKNYALGHT